MIETHAHIYSSKFKEDRGETIERAKENGVAKIIMPNIDLPSIEQMMAVEEEYPDYCIATMGIHPCYVEKDFNKQLYEVEDWLNKRKFCAVGEIGIDLYWDKTLQAEQEEAFKIQVEFAKKHKIPFIIHGREATDEILKVLKSLQDDDLKGVFHCFGGTVEEAEQIIDLGLHIGIGGVSTFKKAGMDKVLPSIDLNKIVLETDCPYLAPVPYRGKRNEPSYLPIIAHQIAKHKEVDVELVAQQTTQNAESLFQL
ncbi:MAG: TatD family hydrolase [Cytophagales bacterium]|nr:TatD family hydrolase [Cytophagales bacterium]